MKTISLILVCFVATTLVPTVFALTTEHEVTLAYVRAHAEEFSVKVAKGEDGLIDFTITHDVSRPMYHVAHLAIYHQDKLITRSDTPSFGKKQDNTFHFAPLPEDIAESKFDLSDGALGYSDSGDAVPVPGTIIHKFRLLDFVPKKLLKSVPDK
jgi:hypothetical protein